MLESGYTANLNPACGARCPRLAQGFNNRESVTNLQQHLLKHNGKGADCPRLVQSSLLENLRDTKMRPLLILFIVMPILEMWVLISVGQEIGALPTIGLVLLTAVVGLALLRKQGVSTIMRAQQKMQAGEMPAREMAEGIFLAVGGALLLTPGFITDALGFACLIPGVRQLIIGRLIGHIVVVRGTTYSQGGYQQPGGARQPGSRQSHDKPHDVIEGDYQREDQREDQKHDDEDGPTRSG